MLGNDHVTQSMTIYNSRDNYSKFLCPKNISELNHYVYAYLKSTEFVSGKTSIQCAQILLII